MINKCSAILLFALLLLMRPFPLHAKSIYAPPGLYDVETLRLQNGMLVVLKQRPEAHNVSLRLVVGIGTRFFDCSRRETPHLIEHLLFSGTSLHTEEELDRMIESNGGSWNAVTGTHTTVYQVDIFDRYTDVAVQTLHEITTGTVITPEKVRKAKNIIYREEGSRPTWIRRFFYRHAIGKSAWQNANEWLLPGDGAVCRDLVDLEGITADDLRSTYRSYYVPGNMTLIVVGNFDRRALLGQLRGSFGMIEAAPVPVQSLKTPPVPANGPTEVTGTFTPFLGTAGSVAVAFRTEGRDSEAEPALAVLTTYLNTLLYQDVRVKSGLSYNPEMTLFLEPDYGILYASADASLKNIGRVRRIMEKTLEQVLRSPVGPEEVEATKRKILLQWVQGYETNAGIANYYAANLNDLVRLGHFRNVEDEIEAVTAEDLDRTAHDALAGGRRIVVRSVPTVTYTAFYTIIGSFFLAVILIAVITARRISSRKDKTMPLYLKRP